MEFNLYLRCFLIGMLASSSLGPIFILTFNRGSLYGFSRGFATALGACFADGIYFFLGLIGILAVLKESMSFMFILDTLGGILLIALGLYSLHKAQMGEKFVCYEHKLGVWLTVVKSFILTLLNPMALLFFMFIGVQILPEKAFYLPLRQVIISSTFVILGSLSVLTLVSFVASRIGHSLSAKSQKRISLATGIIFILLGFYFLDHLFVNVIKLYSH
ncbi:MAG: LysE family transporter [bacterium]